MRRLLGFFSYASGAAYAPVSTQDASHVASTWFAFALIALGLIIGGTISATGALLAGSVRP